MGQKQCGKCGEFVDEAKAFCPECGNAFVDEKKRTSVTDFDRSNPTVQLGETMFNKMLSDMGLDLSKEPQPPPPQRGRVEVTPISVQPAVAVSREQKPAAQPPVAPKRSNTRIWIIAAVIAGVILLALGAVIILVALVLYFRLTG
jgi:hypothetical protein